ENKTMFWIPEGFAHGFIALEDNTQFLYKTTNYYNKESEGAIMIELFQRVSLHYRLYLFMLSLFTYSNYLFSSFYQPV
ncbi:dTDP-4-dehydrorhamnose 3,5-epimerase family protein, partial [Acinetobacter baumannii]|uniref:dTDP-4-dehydrorhamnose 3,5-epimerase family protein n=1 Tax=Acinetobacter baumannii TaxID=470 RepID=UPI001CB80CED